MMNSIIKLCRNNISKQLLYQIVSQSNKLKLHNTIKTNKNLNTSYKFKFILNSGILTWLGFTKDDEEKESELIMTIKRSILLMQRGEYTKSEQMLHLALKLAQEQQNPDGITYVYDIMANLALEKGDTDKAEKLFVNVLQRLLSQGMKDDDIKVIHISLKMARIYQMKGDKEKAQLGFVWCLDSIKNKSEKNDDLKALNAVVQDWYAQFLLENGHVTESLKYLKEAHRLCSEIEGDNSEKSILLLNDLGTVCWKLGDLQNAENYLNRAVNLGKHLDDFEYLGAIYANLGMVYLENGILEEAKKFCKESWRLGKKQNSEDVLEQANYCFEQIKTHV